ncbi:solute carrier family 13 member 5-like isoform X4 [Varroa jacobsoni]|uniref:solute carrier family 13 member 5-like isoform X4 n=1 Tax=Varroa jacobsoni TaxID=62625 RepID=UPI000BF28AD1|nr:solute carrier family 13 member 5-like isoform X4 [Varroa jacobsoni]
MAEFVLDGYVATCSIRMKITWQSVKPKLRCLVAVIIPVLLCPLLLYGTREARCTYVIALMAGYWMFEIMPLSITSLLPVCLFPLLGVISTSDASLPYMKDSIMLFLAGMIMAGAIEKCNLHKRIALKILLIVGGQAQWLMLGFMTTAAFISMWISNMATVLMLLPIVDSVVEEVGRNRDSSEAQLKHPVADRSLSSSSSSSLSINRGGSSSTFRVDENADRNWENDRRELQRGMLLAVAYAANLGGTGSLLGTAPNLILYGIMEEKFPDCDVLSFATWMVYNVPPLILAVLFAWGYLYLFELPKKYKKRTDSESSYEDVLEMIRRRYRDLGPMSFREYAVVVLFGLLVLIWFFRNPRFMPGWSQLIPHGNIIKDATPAIGITVLMFLIPSDPRNHFTGPALLDWKFIQGYIPWGVLLLMGASFSMASAAEKSGLSRLLGQSIAQLEGLPPFVLVVILTVGTAFITELCSNSATASLLLPITAYLASSLRIHPLKLMMPVAISSSFAFMLPVATPPNAVIYEHSGIPTADMVRCGFVMNVVCITIELIAIHTIGDWVFDLSHFPQWAVLTTPFPHN